MISVIMSIFNESLFFIKEAVNSILTQTYKDYEFIIIIDNPNLNDDVMNFLREKSSEDYRIRLVYNNCNIGLALSLNKGIEISNGDYIARMDADDISLPNRLEDELKFMLANNCDLVSTNAIIIDENSNYVKQLPQKPYNPTEELPYSNMILHPSVLIKKKVLIKVGCYRNFRRSQDYDLWLRLLSNGFNIRIMNEYLLKYRINSNSLSSTNRLEQYYTNLYQSKLYFERLKKGYDSFTEINYNHFIKSKKINAKKNKKCIKCMLLLNSAKENKTRKKYCYIFELINAFFIYPSIVFRTILKKLRRR